MSDRMVKFSDLSDRQIVEGETARIVVLDHPALEEGVPRQIDAHVDEVKGLLDASLDVARFELHLPDQEPVTIVMDRREFDQLSTADPMSDVIKSCVPMVERRGKTKATGSSEKIDYSTLENCAKPHRGRTTDAEKKMVQDNFDDVNARLKADGMRELDLRDASIVERYGLQKIAKDRGFMQ